MKQSTAFDSILGQDAAVRRLRQIIERKSLPGAMLFTGPESVGKYLVAVSFAMAVNCDEREDSNIYGCGICGSCHRIEAGIHPDVLTVRPDGNHIKIGQIRDLIEKISTRPKEASTRFVMIDGVSLMTVEAANALLKSLEEPPLNTVFILISSSMLSVLPTIRSRCCNIGFMPLETESVEHILSGKLEYSHEVASSASLMSDGGVRSAVAAIEKGWSERLFWLCSETAALKTMSLPVILALAEEMTRKGDDIKTALEIIKGFFRDLAVFRYKPDSIRSRDSIAVLGRAARYYEDHELVSILEKVHEAQRSLELNAVSRLAVETLFLKIAGFIK